MTLDLRDLRLNLIGIRARVIQPDDGAVLDVVQPPLNWTVFVLAISRPERAVRSHRWYSLHVPQLDVHTLVDRDVTSRQVHNRQKRFSVAGRPHRFVLKTLRMALDFGLVVNGKICCEVHLRMF